MGGNKILITGASGFVGRSLMKTFADSNAEVFPLVRKSVGFKNEIVADFSDPEFCSTVIATLPKVDTVVHLGAKISWDGGSRESLFRPNVMATAELVDWTKRSDAYFIFASTAIVCGVSRTCIDPESAANPDTDYGYSKWLGEELVRMSGVHHAILRICGVFGKDGPSHLGINRAISSAISGQAPVQHGSGNLKRNYVYVYDLCRAIAYCIENRLTGTHFVAGSTENTVAEMLACLCAHFLPGQTPEFREGGGGTDQIVVHSAALPEGLSFDAAIADIKLHHT